MSSNLNNGFGDYGIQNYFCVIIPKDGIDSVKIKEVIVRKSGDKMDEKLEISLHKWQKVQDAISTEFNNILKQERQRVSKFSVGENNIERYLGKEMLVLLWGIENADTSEIDTAIRNWKGLQREERWWLYTLTNASYGKKDDRKGWRAALLFALCERTLN